MRRSVPNKDAHDRSKIVQPENPNHVEYLVIDLPPDRQTLANHVTYTRGLDVVSSSDKESY